MNHFRPWLLTLLTLAVLSAGCGDITTPTDRKDRQDSTNATADSVIRPPNVGSTFELYIFQTDTAGKSIFLQRDILEVVADSVPYAGKPYVMKLWTQGEEPPVDSVFFAWDAGGDLSLLHVENRAGGILPGPMSWYRFPIASRERIVFAPVHRVWSQEYRTVVYDTITYVGEEMVSVDGRELMSQKIQEVLHVTGYRAYGPPITNRTVSTYWFARSIGFFTRIEHVYTSIDSAGAVIGQQGGKDIELIRYDLQ